MCGSVKLTVREKYRLHQATQKPATTFEGPVARIVSAATGNPFAGFAKVESMEKWAPKIVGTVELEIHGFYEKRTYYPRPGMLQVLIIKEKNNKCWSRIVTEAVPELTRTAHCRQPVVIST